MVADFIGRARPAILFGFALDEEHGVDGLQRKVDERGYAVPAIPVGFIPDVAAVEMRHQIEGLIAARLNIVDGVHEGTDANPTAPRCVCRRAGRTQ
jgi:hypothetical protein